MSWKSKRQSVVALSSAEAEFIAASAMVQEVITFASFLVTWDFSRRILLVFMRITVRVGHGPRDRSEEAIGQSILTFGNILCITQLAKVFSN